MQRIQSKVQGNPAPLIKPNHTKFDRAVISLIDQSNIPRNALKEAENLTLAEDGAPTVRPGVAWYGTEPTASGDGIDGAGMHVMSDDTVHLWVISNGTFYRSTNDGATWTACTGATFTAGKKCDSEQIASYTYVGNGWDNLVRYDGTTTLVTYTALSTPTGGSATKTGLTGTTYTYRYRVAAFNAVGLTLASTASTVQVGSLRGTGWDSSNYVTFTWNTVVGATGYNIYIGTTAGEEYYVNTVEGNATTTYIDQGDFVEQTGTIVPEGNTTEGPKSADLTTVGTRLFATRDKDYPWRVWISAPGRLVGQFGNLFEATYVDLQKGSQYKPVKVEDYRDGKGTPLATVWMKSTDGRGAVWQGSIESFTVGDVTFPVPSFSRLPGSRGTDAPYSVVNVLNDYMYYNEQAFYNLGSRAQFLNLLSTDESSANIRPDVKRIRQSAASKIAAHFQDAKVYFSVPIDSDTNNQTMVFDTERKGWLPKAFTIGFERFFAYTDTSGNRHMCAWKPGDTRLSEISDNINGDYGEAFDTELLTGLMHVDPKDRFQFMWVREMEYEFAQTTGTIYIELYGTRPREGFGLVAAVTISPTESRRSYGVYQWTTVQWTYVSEEPTTTSEPSKKRYTAVGEDLNNYQWRIYTDSVTADYVLRTLQLNGRLSLSGKDRSWEVFQD